MKGSNSISNNDSKDLSEIIEKNSKDGEDRGDTLARLLDDVSTKTGK
jgi:hypothetical protein